MYCPRWSSDAPLVTVLRTWSEPARRAFSVVARAPGTHYHLTLDPAVLWTLSNDTSRPTCSDSLNLMPPAPLYLWTLRRYTNPILLSFIIITDGWTQSHSIYHASIASHVKKILSPAICWFLWTTGQCRQISNTWHPSVCFNVFRGGNNETLVHTP